MSKNVAVFVDVANIFYAAKAAGMDIDYVTLLKSATAGRDFVRAYAYTGLDPENENQRQFHAFLARSGYKVVSKDIRKYGDGRIKANLDIELVVDMMRMAEKLDIAVVVSGDGDFAPAIHAVQQQGVRVEVISFRGNTSSDLIDAADVFIDIATVARVEKGVRSGRRVAAEGDLSMTAVPDKESGVTPRRRRSSADERPERAERTERPSRRRVAASPVIEDDGERPVLSGLVALPGERLSRGTSDTAGPDAVSDDDAIIDEPAEAGSDELQHDDGRRRRRRRGGRGRGRGGRADGETADEEPVAQEASALDFADEVPTLPQHSGFGSVWDSQIGVPRQAGSLPVARPRAEDTGDDEPEGEPEVPEYLIAERRQQDRGRGGRGRSGGYRSAIDRERFGTGSRSGFQRRPAQGQGQARGGRSVRPSSSGRASVHAMDPIEQTPGGDPWSEVPPEVQELLRAEMARRQSGSRPADVGRGAARRSTAASAPEAPAVESPAEEPKPKRTTRRRSTAASAPEAPAVESPAEEPKPKRTTRRRSTAASAPEAPAVESPAEEPKPKRTTRRRSTAASAPEAPEA